MLRLLCSTAVLAAVAFSQETMEGSSVVSRRQTVEITQMSNAIQASMDSMSLELSTVRSQLASANSPLAQGIAGIQADMVARSQNLVVLATTNENRLVSMSNQVAAAAAAVTASNNALSRNVAAQLTNLEDSTESSVASLTSTIDGRIATVMSNLVSTTASINATAAAAGVALTASVNSQIRAVNTSLAAVTTALAAKMDAQPHMWMGSCSSTPHGGWHEYCFNRQDIDTARPYFRKENNNRMRTITSGYFSMQFYRLFQSCNWEHTLLYFDGNHRRHTHTWTGGNSRWRDQDAFLTWPMAANKQSWARAWTCNWTLWNTSPHYSRFIMMYVGVLP